MFVEVRGPEGIIIALAQELAVEAGMSAAQAIAAVTRLAAEACGVGDMVGTIEIGKQADLLITRLHPELVPALNGSTANRVQSSQRQMAILLD